MKQITRDGVRTEREDGQDRMLRRLYGNVFGRLLLKLLTARWISKVAGAFLSTRLSCRLIPSFIEKNNIDMSQYMDEKYGSYNEFFCRHIRPEMRPVDTDPAHLISPADSKLTVLPITKDSRFTLKNTPYTLSAMLRSEELAERYQGGYCMIFRLTVDDYHRYCYPAEGEKEENVFLKGKLHTVNPIANDFYPIYKENCREYSVLHTEAFGDLLMMEVGALLVGKIVNHHGKATVTCGQEKGYFKFGGSTVVLLVEKGRVCPDADLLKNSLEGYETVVKLGEKIGVATA